MMMEADKPWVALLYDDEDDYLYWHHGFRSWADHLELRWFTSPHAFLVASGLGHSHPVALLLDGVVPRGDEMNWLSTLLIHPSCQQACVIVLSDGLLKEQHQAYLRLGAADHLVKPSTHQELQAVVMKVSAHVAART